MVHINTKSLHSNMLWGRLKKTLLKSTLRLLVNKKLFSSTIRHTQLHLCLRVSIFRFVMYARIVVDHRPKSDSDNSRRQPHQLPRQAHNTNSQHNNIQTAFEQCAEPPKGQIHVPWHQFFYLSPPLNRYEYMWIAIAFLPPWIVKQYQLNDKVQDGHIYLEMHCAVWGLPQAGILANKLLRKRLAPHRYYKCKNTPGLWKHMSRPISFTLVVDDFSLKYERKEDIDHLIKCIKQKYQLTEDWAYDL